MIDVQDEDLAADLDGHARAAKAWGEDACPAFHKIRCIQSESELAKNARVRPNLQWFLNGVLPSIRAHHAERVGDRFVQVLAGSSSPA
jgi:hypothetical protein